MFNKYYNEIYPARLVFISFLYQNDPGQMVSELKQKYPQIKVMQFRFNGHRPDLSKLDNVFGLLSTESVDFKEDIEKVVEKLNTEELIQITDLLKL